MRPMQPYHRLLQTRPDSQSQHISIAHNYVKCPCNNFIKRHFNQYFVNNNNNPNLTRPDP